MTDKEGLRPMVDYCTLGQQAGPQTIVVRQVIGEAEKQKSLDIHVRVPDRKPEIEQIVDVFVKDVEINSIDVITNKVIVRGDFEIKAIYVACLPDQPVHAVELKNFKWTIDIPIPGARKGMDAEATVDVEYVDYDVDKHTRAYKYKNYEVDDDMCDDDDDDDCNDNHNHQHHHHDDDDCGNNNNHHHHHHHCTRDFDVAVVLRVNAKVLADRQVMIGGPVPNGTLPNNAKG